MVKAITAKVVTAIDDTAFVAEEEVVVVVVSIKAFVDEVIFEEKNYVDMMLICTCLAQQISAT